MKTRTNRRETLLDVQNQYEDIAHLIRGTGFNHPPNPISG